VFTDATEHAFKRYGVLQELSLKEVNAMWDFIYIKKLKTTFDKQRILSFTGKLPREIVLFASFIGYSSNF